MTRRTSRLRLDRTFPGRQAPRTRVVLTCVVTAALSLAVAGHAAAQSSTCVSGQGLQHQQVWWSGNSGTKYRLDFSSGAPTLFESGHAQSPSFEGTAVYTNASGQLLLYSDGVRAWRGSDHVEIAAGLPGDPSATEAALISPVPGGDPLDDFYVFGNSANTTNGTVAYVRVTVSTGMASERVDLSVGNTGESLAAVPHANGSDVWILTLRNNPDPTRPIELAAFLASPAGVATTPVLTELPDLGAATSRANRGNLSFHPPTNTLVLGNFGVGSGVILTAAFDASAGTISDVVTRATGAVGYSSALSPSGRYLYFTSGLEGFQGTARVLDLEDLEAAAMDITFPGVGAVGGCRLAFDGRVYYSSFGGGSLGVVETPDSPTGAFASSLSLGTGRGSYHLPNQSFPACAEAGCASDEDCDDGTCDLATRECVPNPACVDSSESGTDEGCDEAAPHCSSEARCEVCIAVGEGVDLGCDVARPRCTMGGAGGFVCVADDAGPSDAGPSDAGSSDAGSSLPDAGPTDAAVADAGAPEIIDEGGCRCATTEGSPTALLVPFAVMLLLRRRR